MRPFADLGKLNPVFLCNEFNGERKAESGLATAHAGASAPFNGVNGTCRDGRAESLNNLGLAYLFAATDDSAPGGILRNSCSTPVSAST